jgi:hypothetical protein
MQSLPASDLRLGNINAFLGGAPGPRKLSELYGLAPGVPRAGPLKWSDVAGLKAGLYPFRKHTFTPCGATGSTGPTLAQCRAEYPPWADTYLDMDETSRPGIQRWVVPKTGAYRIEAAGAQGGGAFGGKGARLRGTFDLSAGDQLEVLVGQRGTSLNSGLNTSGGGGTFVATTDGKPLIVAGGGAGANHESLNAHGTIEEGAKDQTTFISGSFPGKKGRGGNSGNGNASGGGGFFTDALSLSAAISNTAFINGGKGSPGFAPGGFGGGGYTNTWSTTTIVAGGGGYSGGAGGRNNNNDSTTKSSGGGGGSFNAGRDQDNASGIQTGHGVVSIELLDGPQDGELRTPKILLGAARLREAYTGPIFTVARSSDGAEADVYLNGKGLVRKVQDTATRARTFGPGALETWAGTVENPQMTSDTSTATLSGTPWEGFSTASWTASARTVFSGPLPAWYAFDKVLTGNPSLYHSNNNASMSTTPEWLRLDYPEQVVLKSYTLRSRDGDVNKDKDFPNDFDIQATNSASPAESDWVTLDTRTGQASLVTSPLQNLDFDIAGNYTPYQKYRIRVRGVGVNNGGRGSEFFFVISEFFLNTVSMLEVSTWYDQSGNAIDATGYAVGTATRPRLAVDKAPYVHFPGVNSTTGGYFDLGSTTWNVATNGGFAFVGLVNMKDTRSWERVFDFGKGQANDNIIFARSGTTTNVRFSIFQGTTQYPYDLSNMITNNTWQIFCGRFAKAGNNQWTFSVWVDGVRYDSALSVTLSDRDTPKSYIGKSNWADWYAYMDVKSLVFFDTGSVSDAEILEWTEKLRASVPILDRTTATTQSACRLACSLRHLRHGYPGPLVRLRKTQDNGADVEEDFHGSVDGSVLVTASGQALESWLAPLAENPAMTGNSTATVTGTAWKDYASSGFVASASSAISVSTPAWRAFDKVSGTVSYWHSVDNASMATNPEWLRLDFPVQVVLKRYALTARDQTGTYSTWDFPNTFDIQGTNATSPTDADWVSLDTQTGQASLVLTGFQTLEYDLYNTTAYAKYRILIKGVGPNDGGRGDGSYFAVINEFRLQTTRVASVRTWYDQSGNAKHAVQTTASMQPTVFTESTSKRFAIASDNEKSHVLQITGGIGIAANADRTAIVTCYAEGAKGSNEVFGVATTGMVDMGTFNSGTHPTPNLEQLRLRNNVSGTDFNAFTGANTFFYKQFNVLTLQGSSTSTLAKNRGQVIPFAFLSGTSTDPYFGWNMNVDLFLFGTNFTGRRLTGKISEISIFDAFIPDSDMLSLEASSGQLYAKKGALDSLNLATRPVAAYSLRRLFGSHDGPMVRVRLTNLATGGTVTEWQGYRIHAFQYNSANDNGGQTEYTFSIDHDINADVLVVAGGGAGFRSNVSRGGGGAGGLVLVQNIVLNNDNVIRVGRGGVSTTVRDGMNSSLNNIVATGGGGEGRNGGSGGGGQSWNDSPIVVAGTGVPGQGNDGGLGFLTTNQSDEGAGGGGGAGQKGFNGQFRTGGKGGDGLYMGHIFSDSFGSQTHPGWFAGGGGGSSRATSPVQGLGGKGGGGDGRFTTGTPSHGESHTGGGGGGTVPAGNGIVGAGGSGIVLVRYAATMEADVTFDDQGNVESVDDGTRVLTGPGALDEWRGGAADLSVVTWYDQSGNGFDATGESSPFLVSKSGLGGKGQFAIRFNGVDNTGTAFTIPYDAKFNMANQVTVYSDIRLTDSGNSFVFEKGSVNTQYSLFLNSSSILWRTHNTSGTRQDLLAGRSSVIFNDTWQSVVGTYDGAAKRIYVDGVQKASVGYTQTLRSLSTSSAIGKFGGTSTNTGTWFFGGDMSDVYIFNTGLSASTITSLHQLRSYAIVEEGLELWIDPLSSPARLNGPGIAFQGNPQAKIEETDAGRYIDINGTSQQYISTLYKPNLDNNTLYTWELWFWDDAPGLTSSTNTALISNYGPDGTTPFARLHVRDTGTLIISERNTGNVIEGIDSSASYTDGRWHHIVKVADASLQRLYVDGVQIITASRPGGVITSGQNIVIGGNHLGRYQTCRLGPVRCYRGKALTQAEVLQNYNAEKDRLPTF